MNDANVPLAATSSASCDHFDTRMAAVVSGSLAEEKTWLSVLNSTTTSAAIKNATMR